MSFFPNPISAAGSTTPRPLSVRFGEVFNVKDFGATGDGATDDSAAIQAAIDAAAASTSNRSWQKFKGATVYFPQGIYTLNTGLTLTSLSYSGISLTGDGVASTLIRLNISSGNGITVGNTTDQIPNVSITNMMFYSEPVMSSGSSVIRLINTYGAHLTHLNFSENPSYPNPLSGNAFDSSFTRIYTCIDVQSGATNQLAFQNYIENVNINNGVFGIKLGDNGGIVQDTYISKSIVAQCTDTGVMLKNTGGTYLSEGSTLFCKNGLVTYPDIGKTVMWTFLSGWICDTSVTDGYKIITNNGTVRSIQMVNCWASNNGRWQNGQSSEGSFPSEGRGIWISQGSGQVKGLTITNFTGLINRQEGILVVGASKISIMNPNLCGNGAFANNTYDGIYFFNSSEWSINGGMSGDTVTDISNTQRYGVNIGGTSNKYQVIGMNLIGNQTGGLNDGGGPTKHVTANLS